MFLFLDFFPFLKLSFVLVMECYFLLVQFLLCIRCSIKKPKWPWTIYILALFFQLYHISYYCSTRCPSLHLHSCLTLSLASKPQQTFGASACLPHLTTMIQLKRTGRYPYRKLFAFQKLICLYVKHNYELDSNNKPKTQLKLSNQRSSHIILVICARLDALRFNKAHASL